MTAKVTKATKVAKAEKEPVEVPPDEALMGVIPAGTWRNHLIAVAPPGWTPEQVARHLGFAA